MIEEGRDRNCGAVKTKKSGKLLRSVMIDGRRRLRTFGAGETTEGRRRKRLKCLEDEYSTRRTFRNLAERHTHRGTRTSLSGLRHRAEERGRRASQPVSKGALPRENSREIKRRSQAYSLPRRPCENKVKFKGQKDRIGKTEERRAHDAGQSAGGNHGPGKVPTDGNLTRLVRNEKRASWGGQRETGSW